MRDEEAPESHPVVTLRPLDSGRHPFELFVLGLGVVVGWPLLVGAPAPGSTLALLGTFWARVWAWMLVGGCLMALLGVWWTWWRWVGRWWHRFRPTAATGLLIEQVGLVAVGAGTLIYGVGVAAALAADTGRFVPAGLVTGWGLACFWRAWQIQRWVRAVLRDRDK